MHPKRKRHRAQGSNMREDFWVHRSVPEAIPGTDRNCPRGVPEVSKVDPNYFTSSDPHHDMLGGGCQVRVVIENTMGRMENLKTLTSGFLGLVILVRWALVTMFLS